MCGIGCDNRDKYMFWAPRNQTQRELWMRAAGKTYSDKTNFQICEDHFDVSLVKLWNFFITIMLLDAS